jgi:hypothetical protein
VSILRILGNNRKLCDGISRRDLIQAGALSLFGLTMSDLFRLEYVPAAASTLNAQGSTLKARTFGRAKSVVILFLYGSPGQLDTWDMKPDQPESIRGPFKPIRTSNPSIEVCEHLPRTAKWMHRVATVRTMTHEYPIHGVAFALTGTGRTDLAMETNTRDPRHWPYFGSVIDYVETTERRRRNDERRTTNDQRPARRGAERNSLVVGRSSLVGSDELPNNVILPHRFGRPGPQPQWLGAGWGPAVTNWVGKSTGADPYGQGRENPYGGITPETRFQLMERDAGRDITLDRLHRRFSLKEQLDAQRRELDASDEVRGFGRAQQLALNMITSDKLRNALDVQAEPVAVREAYGMTLFGQATLAARRLVEAGVRVTTVFWDEYNLGNSAWDTHVFLVNRMKDELLPGFDRAFTALMKDLDDRGLLDETLVCVMSEHGRTPKFHQGYDGSGPQGGGGRDHWSHAYGALFAGAGIKEGVVIGKTDATGGYPEERPVSPKDVLATIYHLLGIDPHATILDPLRRPVPLVEGGEVMWDMLV